MISCIENSLFLYSKIPPIPRASPRRCNRPQQGFLSVTIGSCRIRDSSAHKTVVGSWRGPCTYDVRMPRAEILGTLKKASAVAFQGTGSDPFLIRACVQPFCAPRDARASASRCGRLRRVGGRRCSQPSLHLPSTCPPFSPRALTRARYGGAALGLSSRASSCPQHGSMALSARACCAGAAAKAPTQRVARRNRRRMWCLGLRLDAHGGGGGGGDGSYLCSTPS